MTLPYYEQLETSGRKIEIKLDNEKGFIQCKVLASYISPRGHLIDILTTHKQNNFVYAIDFGLAFLNDKRYNSLIKYPAPEIRIADEKDLEIEIELCSKYGFGKTPKEEYIQSEQDSLFIPLSVFRDIQLHTVALTSSDLYREERNKLYEKLNRLIATNCVNSWDIVEYYNLCDAMRIKYSILENKHVPYEDYSEEVRQNLIGIISGHIAIRDFFLELKKYVEGSLKNEKLATSLKDKNDFLVSFVGFDKVESQLRKSITTSKTNINEQFFNYLIMDWDIYQIPGFVVDRNHQCLKEVQDSPFSMVNNSGLERELEKEICLIKKHVPYSERKNYFI